MKSTWHVFELSWMSVRRSAVVASIAREQGKQTWLSRKCSASKDSFPRARAISCYCASSHAPRPAAPCRPRAVPPIPLLVFSICHYSTYTLGPTLKISPCLLGGHPTKRWPMCLCLPTSLCLALPLYYVRARVRTACVLACLQPACANFILHTTAPRSHYIAWLGLLQKKTNDGRSCTDTGLIP